MGGNRTKSPTAVSFPDSPYPYTQKGLAMKTYSLSTAVLKDYPLDEVIAKVAEAGFREIEYILSLYQ